MAVKLAITPSAMILLHIVARRLNRYMHRQKQLKHRKVKWNKTGVRLDSSHRPFYTARKRSCGAVYCNHRCLCVCFFMGPPYFSQRAQCLRRLWALFSFVRCFTSCVQSILDYRDGRWHEITVMKFFEAMLHSWSETTQWLKTAGILTITQAYIQSIVLRVHGK